METSDAVRVEGRRLGKRPPKYDPRTLRAANYIRPGGLPSIPRVIDRMDRVLKHGPYPMLANDRLGDCTCAAIGHVDITTEDWGQHPAVAVADREAATVALYSRVSGYDPASGANDNGAYLLDVLKEVQKNGHGGDGADRIGPYLSVDPLDDRQMRACLFLFGVLYAGMALPVSAQAEVGKVWQRTTGAGSEPGSWGGHAVFLGRITAKERTVVTWGAPQRMTADWQRRYMDEVWTFVDPDFIRDHTRRTVGGLDLAGLMSDLEQLRK